MIDHFPPGGQATSYGVAARPFKVKDRIVADADGFHFPGVIEEITSFNGEVTLHVRRLGEKVADWFLQPHECLHQSEARTQFPETRAARSERIQNEIYDATLRLLSEHRTLDAKVLQSMIQDNHPARGVPYAVRCTLKRLREEGRITRDKGMITLVAGGGRTGDHQGN